MFVRVEVAVRPEFSDPGADSLLRRLELVHPEIRRLVRWARLLEIYWIDMDCTREKMITSIGEIFWDRVMNWLFTGDLIPSAAGTHGGILDLFDAAPDRLGCFWALERRFRPGVTDNVGRTTLEAFEIVLGKKLPQSRAASGSLFLLEGANLTEEHLATIARDVFCNELIESWTALSSQELKTSGRFHPDQIKLQLPKMMTRGSDRLEEIKLDKLDDDGLLDLSKKRLWALSTEEMKAIRRHFTDPERLERRKAKGLLYPTDVEMEVFAQTWSEHCKHKIFGAEIQYKDKSRTKNAEEIPAVVDGLFKSTIVGTTEEIKRPWLLSVFEDNAGIVAFDEEDAVCIKVETHNSPSALDPYGGALTGIVGVNRDILGCGRGARPIFNTDVFCLAEPSFMQTLPERLLHPRRILDGVRRGVEHGGNKSGIPTINGALVFDGRYLGKPLIYCGTAGIMPRVSAGMPCESKEVLPGDRICMVGGRIGKDGIHGATFSSLALDEHSPVSAVQLGDPITQKRMSDFLLEARELGLYRTLTDNGAGGLSSSVGELARAAGGAKIDVSLAKTKYPGLKPYELVVSESQERMTVVVPPEKLSEFMSLAARRTVEVSDLGEFTRSGAFEIDYKEKCIAYLELEFLHGGAPKMKFDAEWTGLPPVPASVDLSFEADGPKRLLELLGRPNISSKEWMIRQYDHEVQGMSVVKPLHTVSPGTAAAQSGPNDGGVIKPKAGSWAGLSVGCGINPKLSDIDPYLMAQSAVDEAVRNVLCVGAEFGRAESVLALIDNFCWPDPVEDPGKAAALVRACYGLREAALALGTPFISGKDSMKNDFRGKHEGKQVVISVPPTLLVTALARVPDVRLARTSDFKAPSDAVYLLGGAGFGLLGSELHSHLVDQLRARGGNDKQVVMPSTVFDPKKGTEQVGSLRVGRPNWGTARAVYSWLGSAEGKRQSLLRSAHDVSDGGVLVAIAESLIARGLGAQIEVPVGADLWEWSFGEGFHSIVVSARDSDVALLETEWKELGVPFIRIGTVTGAPELELRWKGTRGNHRFSVPTVDLLAAWKKEGYWQ